jgi:Clp amino terminal domain, pathogenicity island component
MNDSESGGGKLFGRFTEQAHRVLDLAREEAERAGHRYVGPEHVLLGLLAEGQSGAAWVLRVHGVDRAAARAALARRGNRGVVPAPRPSDAELLSSLGIDLDAVRYQIERRFGVPAVGEATWRVTRRRWWQGARVVRGSRRHRRIIAHVGLPEGYRGAAGPPRAVLGVDLDQLVAAVTAELGEVQR